MALDFPSSPANGQVYTSNSRSWVYDTTANAWTAGSGTTLPPVACRLYLGANTANLTNGAWTSIVFDGETADLNGMHAASNTRVYCASAGYYTVTGKAYMFQHADMGAYLTGIGVAVDGSLQVWDFQSWRVPGSYVSHSVGGVVYAGANSYIELQAYSQYLGKVISNSTVNTTFTVASTGLTGATGPTGAQGSPTAWTEQQDVTGTSTQNLHNFALNSNAAVLNFTSIHASNNYITGITGGTPGRRLVIRNGQTSNSSLYLLVATESTSSNAENRILAHRYSPIEVGNGRALDLLYVNGTNRWVVTQTSAG